MKREPTVWENIFVNDTSDKGLISKIKNKIHDSTPVGQAIQLKMGKELEQILVQGGCTEGPETYERMLRVTSHQRDTI